MRRILVIKFIFAVSHPNCTEKNTIFPKFLIANTGSFVYNIEAVTLIAMMRKVVVISGRYEVSRVFTRSECQLKPTTSHCTESSVIAEMTRAIHSVAL